MLINCRFTYIHIWFESQFFVLFLFGKIEDSIIEPSDERKKKSIEIS